MNYRGVIVTEGEFEEVVSFNSKEELNAFSDGLIKGANLYGAGSCALYTLDDCLDDLEKDVAELVRKHLSE